MWAGEAGHVDGLFTRARESVLFHTLIHSFLLNELYLSILYPYFSVYFGCILGVFMGVWVYIVIKKRTNFAEN